MPESLSGHTIRHQLTARGDQADLVWLFRLHCLSCLQVRAPSQPARAHLQQACTTFACCQGQGATKLLDGD